MIMSNAVNSASSSENEKTRPSIAVLIPCYNEELTIAEVVQLFRAQLPEAVIYVFDNNSSDQTSEQAQAAGAIVIRERRQGKGYVVQSMFQRVEADIYVLVDGDGELPPEIVHSLIAPVLDGEADMVVGSRFHAQASGQFKRLNRMGNKVAVALLNFIFKTQLTDVLSGYRVFNRKFVKGIPLFGGGFEIETELTIKAVVRRYRVAEVPINVRRRARGSLSKINLFRDGFIILNTILALFRDYQPLTFFGLVGLFLIFAGLLLGLVAIFEVTRIALLFRPAFYASIILLVVAGMISLAVGLILHSIARRSQELEYQLQVMANEFNQPPELTATDRMAENFDRGRQ